jgi:RNA polymerase-binding transcription factor DksA
VQTELDALARDFESVISDAAGNPPDDEHDPSGATIGFERAQLSAVIAMLERRRAELDAALARVYLGTYGRCERCGDPIAPDRLDAQPTAATCISCATPRSRRR